MTPLLDASGSETSEVFSALLRHGADATRRDVEGRDVIHRGARGEDWDVMRVILASGVHANFRDAKGRTALHLVPSGCRAVVEDLLEHGADIDARDSGERTALHCMAQSPNRGGVSSIEAPIRGGATTETRDFPGQTPLHIVTACGSILAMRALLRSGVDLKAPDSGGFSPLHLVVKGGAGRSANWVAEGVDLLLRWGADETATVPELPSYSDEDDHSGDSDDSGHYVCRASVIDDDYFRGETAAQPWSGYGVGVHRVSAADAAAVRKLLADAQKDRAWRRRGCLVLVRAFSDSVQLKVESRGTAIAARASAQQWSSSGRWRRSGGGIGGSTGGHGAASPEATPGLERRGGWGGNLRGGRRASRRRQVPVNCVVRLGDVDGVSHPCFVPAGGRQANRSKGTAAR